MKKTILTFILLAAITGSAMAQSPHQNQNSFNIYIGKLGKAIDEKDLTLQSSYIQSLEGLMDNSITYLKAHPKAGVANPNIPVETQIESYVKGLPTNKIVSDKATLISKLNQFANTMLN